MKSLLLTSTGALLVAMISSCGTSTPGTTTGNGGSTTGMGGGSAGTGGDGGAAGGTGGATGTGGTGGAAADLPTIMSNGTGTENYGTWFSPTAPAASNQAFIITPCTDAGTGFDCGNLPLGSTACLTNGAAGNKYTEVFTVTGGDPTKIYDVTVNALGQVEPKRYQNGAQSTGFTAANPNAVNDLLFTGNAPSTATPYVIPVNTDYNIFDMTIAPPTGGTPIAGAAPYFSFNAVDAAHAGAHYNFQINETFTFKVMTGFTITLQSFDSNCRAIMNCGNGGPYGGPVATCLMTSRTVPNVTLPATFRGQALANGGAQPFQTQFVNLKITNVVAE